MDKKNKLKGIIKILVILILLSSLCAVDNENVQAKVAKNENDVRILKQIIKEQRSKGATVSKNINNKKQYGWDAKTGRLKKLCGIVVIWKVI